MSRIERERERERDEEVRADWLIESSAQAQRHINQLGAHVEWISGALIFAALGYLLVHRFLDFSWATQTDKSCKENIPHNMESDSLG